MLPSLCISYICPFTSVVEAMCGHTHRVLLADHAVKYVKPKVCVMYIASLIDR